MPQASSVWCTSVAQSGEQIQDISRCPSPTTDCRNLVGIGAGPHGPWPPGTLRRPDLGSPWNLQCGGIGVLGQCSVWESGDWIGHNFSLGFANTVQTVVTGGEGLGRGGTCVKWGLNVQWSLQCGGIGVFGQCSVWESGGSGDWIG